MVKFDRLLGWSNPRKWKPIWQLWLQCKTPIPYTSMVCTTIAKHGYAPYPTFQVSVLRKPKLSCHLLFETIVREQTK